MAARKTSRESTPARPRHATQTIEEIEAQAAAIVEADRRALNELAAFMREQAVLLPVESELPRRLAKAAKTLASFGARHGDLQPAGFECGVGRLIDDVGHEHEARLVQDTLNAIDACADVPGYGKAFGMVARTVREHLDRFE